MHEGPIDAFGDVDGFDFNAGDFQSMSSLFGHKLQNSSRFHRFPVDFES
jgi:hypothetical protein